MSYITDTIGYDADELGLSEEAFNALDQLVEKFDEDVMVSPLFDMIIPESSFRRPEDFISSWDDIKANMKSIKNGTFEHGTEEENGLYGTLDSEKKKDFDDLLKQVEEIQNALGYAEAVDLDDEDEEDDDWAEEPSEE